MNTFQTIDWTTVANAALIPLYGVIAFALLVAGSWVLDDWMCKRKDE